MFLYRLWSVVYRILQLLPFYLGWGLLKIICDIPDNASFGASVPLLFDSSEGRVFSFAGVLVLFLMFEYIVYLIDINVCNLLFDKKMDERLRDSGSFDDDAFDDETYWL